MMQRKPAHWFTVLALGTALITAAPAAFAQEESTPADETADETNDGDDDDAAEDGETSEPSKDEDAEAGPAQQDEPKEDEAPAEEPEPTETVEEAPTPPPASPAATPTPPGGAALAPAPTTGDVDQEEAAEAEEGAAAAPGAGAAGEAGEPEADKTNNAAALGAASPVVAADEAGKPWLISASLSTSLGSSVLADQNNDPVFAYSFSATGLYKLTKLWQGRLDAYGFITFNQNLTEGVTTADLGGTGRNQFFLQDIQLGLLGRGVYTEKVTGIIFGFRSIARLPTSDLALAFDRVLRWDNGLTMTKPFSNVGPGTILLSFSGTFRKDFGPNNPSLDEGENPSRFNACVGASPGAADGCFTDVAPLDWSIISSLGARYLLNNGLGFNVALSHLYNRSHQRNFEVDRIGDTNQSEIPIVGDVQLCDPEIANCDAQPTSNLLFASISVSYVFNANWSVSGGLQTFQNVLVQNGDNSRGPSNPFFANDAETNASTFFLSGTFTY